LGGALALLHLVTFDEPFGLAMIEAMACGTPVIGMRRGAVPEVVVDGQTGVLVGDVAGAVRAPRVVAGLDRGRRRTWVKERFTADTMVQGYLDVYAEVLERWPSRRARAAGGRAEAAIFQAATPSGSE
jgi:glycosyltransferase involved in cell wall biosynthesis